MILSPTHVIEYFVIGLTDLFPKCIPDILIQKLIVNIKIHSASLSRMLMLIIFFNLMLRLQDDSGHNFLLQDTQTQVLVRHFAALSPPPYKKSLTHLAVPRILLFSK